LANFATAPIASTIMGEQSKADVVAMRVGDGDKVMIEGLCLDVMYTPGHTDDSYSYLMADRVFTGDTPADPRHRPYRFPERQSARAQYDSIFGRLLKLPDETMVFSGPRLQGRYGLNHRRGKTLQSAAAGALGG